MPARFASSRFPGKPLALIRNKPMIQWVYEKTSTMIKHLFVATDDQRIREAVESFGGKVVMTSPDHKTGTERCREAYEIIRSGSNMDFTHIINIQGDEPLIRTEQLSELMSCFDHAGVDLATLIQPFGPEENVEDPNMVKVVIDKHFRALYFSRAAIPFVRNRDRGEWRRDNPIYKHIGLYAYKAEVLSEITRLQPTILEQAEMLEQLRWLENGYRIQTAISNYQSIGVDTPEDLEKLIRRLEDT